MLETQSADSAIQPMDTAFAQNSSQPIRENSRMMLELAAVDLICQFESMLSQCVRCRQNEEMELIGEIVEQTMREALQFGESHLAGKSRTDLIRRTERATDFAEELTQAVSACSWDAVRRLVGREPVTELDVLRIHDKLGNTVAIVALTAIGPVIETLGQKSGSGAEILKCLKLLAAEIKASW